jgi:hydroxymethylbilane synthase
MSLRLRALVASPEGRRIVRAEALGDSADAEGLGRRVADALRAQGAGEILAALSK